MTARIMQIADACRAALGSERSRYAGKRILVAGSGHSAFNVLLDLVDLPIPRWRRPLPGRFADPAIISTTSSGGINDALHVHGELGACVQRLVEEGRLRLVTGMRITQLDRMPEGIVVTGQDVVLPPVDEIIAATGFRLDLNMLSELRLALDPAVESPVALAPLIDPNLHSCGSVPPHGAEELRHPDFDLYIAGMKSYGRAPTFLMLTRYEQVR